MQSRAATVEEYLASLPEDRRAAVAAVRNVILDNLHPDYVESMSYGMIGYAVPHRVYPAGYHSNPRLPLPFASLASQKGHMALYLMAAYCAGAPEPEAYATWFREAWAKSGKKLDMGKACIRFKKLDDLPLPVIGEAVRRVPAKTYVAWYEAGLAQGAANKVARAKGGAEKGAIEKAAPVEKGAAAKVVPTKKGAIEKAAPAKKGAAAKAVPGGKKGAAATAGGKKAAPAKKGAPAAPRSKPATGARRA